MSYNLVLYSLFYASNFVIICIFCFFEQYFWLVDEASADTVVGRRTTRRSAQKCAHSKRTPYSSPYRAARDVFLPKYSSRTARRSNNSARWVAILTSPPHPNRRFHLKKGPIFSLLAVKLTLGWSINILRLILYRKRRVNGGALAWRCTAIICSPRIYAPIY